MDLPILHKFYKGLASKEEKEAIRQWLESNPRHKEMFSNERELLNAAIFSTKHPDFMRKTTEKKRYLLRGFYLEILKIAAVVTLTLAGGFYFYTKKMEVVASAVHTVTVPAGQRAHILLPDGTGVWLNARSEIKYPSFFPAGKRRVELNGEAYFEVSRNPGASFVVHTDKWDVEALGTTFNVDAYSRSDNFSVALIEGSVKVTDHENAENTMTLPPRYKADAANGVLSACPIDDYDAYRWRDGLLCFKDISFIELLQRLEKCYDISIVAENDNLSDYVISGKLRISDGIDNALRVLQKDAKYTYIRDSETNVIYIK
jgi:ferric-dicitrate binding protein FerR (iron transport regulator)